jgi:hypothetical protein
MIFFILLDTPYQILFYWKCRCGDGTSGLSVETQASEIQKKEIKYFSKEKYVGRDTGLRDKKGNISLRDVKRNTSLPVIKKQKTPWNGLVNVPGGEKNELGSSST